MELWRISNYADLKGIGGLRAGGRWHHAGNPVVYLAEHPALAMLETLVHFEVSRIDALPKRYQLLRIAAPDELTVAEIPIADMPDDWQDDQTWTRNAGTEWLRQQPSALLRVPSVLVPSGRNYLLNPLHADAAKLSIVEVLQTPYDARIRTLLGER